MRAAYARRRPVRARNTHSKTAREVRKPDARGSGEAALSPPARGLQFPELPLPAARARPTRRLSRGPAVTIIGVDPQGVSVRPLIVRRVITRSSAAVLKRRWREQQREWGDRGLSDMTEVQIWWLVRVLVLLLNSRDSRKPGLTHARALARRLDWSQGVLMPRLQRLESLGWVTSDIEVRTVSGKRCRVQSYTITGAGEAVAVVMAPYLQELCAIEPREHRKL